MEKDLEDIHWIDEVLEGKTEAYAQVVDKYKDRVFALATSMLKQREEAEEVAQDVFVKIFKALPKFQRKAKFSTWMYRIAYNECVSRLRKQKIHQVSVENISTKDLLPFTEENEERQEAERRSSLLNKALLDLSQADRGLVHLYYFENLSVEDITHASGLSASNVKTKLFRIRKKLHDVLMPQMQGELI